jgi:hypothetical protein
MAESDLSAEVNATTVLPAPSNLSATTNDNGNVDLSWTNNDDSSDGGIDVERSTDGFSTVNTVTSGLSPSATTYTDTSTSGGETYEYRIERNTDHAKATSGTTSIRVPKIMVRSVGLAGAGQTDATRSGLTKARLTAIHGQGEVATARALTKPRNTTLTADAELATTRSGTHKARTATLASAGQTAAELQFREAFPSELTRNLAWDYNDDRRGFESEWSYQVGPDGAGSVALYLEGTFTDVDPCTPTAIVDYDADGDGTVDERSLARSVPAPDLAVVFPDLSGGDGYYRILLRDLRPSDILTAVIVGPTHT